MKPEEIHPKIQRLIRHKPNSFIFYGSDPGTAAAIRKTVDEFVPIHRESALPDDEIRGCPFCGSRIDAKDSQAMGDRTLSYSVVCPLCDASGPSGMTPRMAIESWNIRMAELGGRERPDGDFLSAGKMVDVYNTVREYLVDPAKDILGSPGTTELRQEVQRRLGGDGGGK